MSSEVTSMQHQEVLGSGKEVNGMLLLQMEVDPAEDDDAEDEITAKYSAEDVEKAIESSRPSQVPANPNV